MSLSKIIIASVLLLSYQQNVFAQLIPFCEKSKWGFANTDGKIVLPCSYDSVEFFSNDNLAKVKKTGKFGYINKQGTIVVPIEYDYCSRIYEFYRQEYSIGIKPNATINLNTDFDWPDAESGDNRYVASKNMKYGVLGLVEGKPKAIIAFNYSAIQFDPAKKIFYCSNGTSITYFTKAGVQINKDQVDKTEAFEMYGPDFAEDILPEVIKVNGKFGVVKQTSSYGGKKNYDTLVPAIYDSIIMDKKVEGFGFNEELFAVKKNGKWGAFDNKHKLILPIEYDNINYDLSKYYKHWLDYTRTFYVEQNGKWGALGKQEKSNKLTELLPFEYDGFNSIYYSYISLEKSGKFEVYNTSENRIITKKSYPAISKYEYESVGPFELFQVTNQTGQTVFVGENGVEFFTD